jgi:hypothetical protein
VKVNDDENAVAGQWVHAHEEDTEDEMVFRPADRPLPPSRGRMSFELRRDGTYSERSPGPVDAPVQAGGRWSLEGDRLILEGEGERPGHAWRIAAIEPGRLTVHKE